MRVRNLSCPYCKKRTTRDKLVNHIEYNHSDQLPEGFTPLRMAFHVANNKPIEYRRPCRICKQPTEWDEKKGRYNFLCSNPICKEKYIDFMKKSMGDKYGAYRPTATPEGLEKMLAARKISGTYKWSDGTIFSYTGSYELETLKFMDKGLEFKSEDLMVPGPILEYELEINGVKEKHLYISDMYYRPYNLLIEVKDGGRSKNMNKEYALTRAKQMAKEKYVIEKTDYNYIRLTDKDFSQLLAVLADLKMHLVDNDNERVIHVNENTAIGAINPITPFNTHKDLVVVNYMQHHAYTGDDDYCIADNPMFDNIYTRDDNGKLIKTDKTILNDTSYTPYIVRNCKEKVFESIYDSLGKDISKDWIYEQVFGKKFSKDQIMFETTAEKYEDYYSRFERLEESVSNYILEEFTKYNDSFKKREIDFKYKSLDINSPEAKQYIENNSYTKKYLDYLSQNTGEILIDIDNDKLIGYVFVGVSKDKGFISTVEVIKDYRGYGFGKQLVKDAIDNYGAIDLVVDKTNKVAYELYKKLGFVIIGEAKNNKAWWMKLKSRLDKKDNIINESSDLSSSVDSKHKQKEALKLSSFAKEPLSKEVINKLKSKSDLNVREGGKGFVWKDGDELVCFINTKGKEIVDLEVFGKYKSHGLSKQLLDFAVKDLGCDNLYVVKENKLAKKIYEDYGFVVSKEVSENGKLYGYEMTLKKSTNEGYILTKRKFKGTDIYKLFFVKSKDGVDNACVYHMRYSKPMRGRSSMLVLKEVHGETYVFLRKNKDGSYSAPGGGWERYEDPKDSAIRECNEEARMKVGHVKYCGELIEYSEKVEDVQQWVKDNVENPNDWWYGYYSKIYVGFYDGEYNGYIKERDKDDFYKLGKFYLYNDIQYDIPSAYAEAIDKFLRGEGE